MFLLSARSLLIVALFVFPATSILPEGVVANSPAALTAAQIVDQMQRHNMARSEALRHWKSIRHYKVEYRGFSTSLAAQMEVEYSYDAVSGKSFRILSQSGSKFLLDKVLKRALDSEKEASQDKAATALSAANYNFRFLGNDSVQGRPAYVLEVEPKVASKFLYRGKIWIDAAEFALAKFDAEPAKNPSLWIARTMIHQSFAKTGDYWLPQQNLSETKVRIGGTAVFAIDYGTYELNAHTP
jgi:hypothetical protein